MKKVLVKSANALGVKSSCCTVRHTIMSDSEVMEP